MLMDVTVPVWETALPMSEIKSFISPLCKCCPLTCNGGHHVLHIWGAVVASVFIYSLRSWLCDFPKYTVTVCLLAVIICHSTAAWLLQYIYVRFNLSERDQYAACYEGDEVIRGHGVWSGLLWGLVIDFRFRGIPASRMAWNTDRHSYECVEKFGIFTTNVRL